MIGNEVAAWNVFEEGPVRRLIGDTVQDVEVVLVADLWNDAPGKDHPSSMNLPGNCEMKL